jgi:DNA-binding winged helix-turn-helix (wHTH) protein
MDVSATHDLLRFGVFELNVTTEELRKSGTLIRLAPQPLKLLALLARRSGQVVSRDEIQKTLWGGETYVDFEQGMNHCVKQIRNALSDSADTPLYVETVPRRGYRFLAPVVTKRVLAPPPRVVESQSGVPLSGSAPAILSAAKPSVSDPTAALKAQPAAVAPVEAVLAPVEIKPASKSASWKIVLIVVVLLAAIVAALAYWRTRKTACLGRKDNVAAMQTEKVIGKSYAACAAGLRLAAAGFFGG